MRLSLVLSITCAQTRCYEPGGREFESLRARHDAQLLVPVDVRYGHMRHAASVDKHPSVTGQPVATLHVLGRPGIQQLAEAQSCDKDPRFADLARLDLHPLDRIAGVVDFHSLARRELARRDRICSSRQWSRARCRASLRLSI